MNADPARDINSFAILTSDDRLREIAAIFAAGILRLGGLAARVTAISDNSSEVIEKSLEKSG